MILWAKPSQRAEADAIIKWLLSRCQPTGGWHVDGRNEIAIRELGSSARPRLSPGMVMRVLEELNRAKDDTPEGFERTYKVLAGESRRAPAAAWTFYFPTHAELDTDIDRLKPIRILQRSFRLVRASAVERRLGSKTLCDRSLKSLLHTSTPFVLPPTFLVVSQVGTSGEDAWRRLTPAFDTLRGLIEYAFGFGGGRISNEPKPRAHLRHPEWMLFKAPGRPVDGLRFLVEGPPPTHTPRLTRRHLDAISDWASRFRKEPTRHSTMSLIIDALRLYAQAMDRSDDHASFLAFWQLAETLALTDRGGTQEICKRLAWHAEKLELPGSGFAHLLEEFADLRNDIVHRGILDVDYEQVNFMKRIAERALLWVIHVSRDLPTKEHLKAFYQLRTNNNTVLDAVAGAARFVRGDCNNSVVRQPLTSQPTC